MTETLLLHFANRTLLKNVSCWLLVISLTLLVNIAWAQVSLVADINKSGEPVYASEFSNLIQFNGEAYFVIKNTELWKSDGTGEGTLRLKKFQSVNSLRVAGNFLFFTANDGITGQELWRCDGTASGTVQVKDLRAGAEGSVPTELVTMNGKLFFVANDGVKGKELWTSDGTIAGTKIVKDILRVVGSSNPACLAVMNNKLYFRANDGTAGYELWTSDGTTAGTNMVKDIWPGSKKSSSPEQIVSATGKVFFVANDGTNGKQLWQTDGTENGTSLVAVIRPGGNNEIGKLISVNETVFFQANDGIYGAELWKSDGTAAGTALVKDFTPGAGSESGYATEHLDHFYSANGKLYLLAYNGSQNLWVSDGTEAGTIQLTSIWGISFSWINPFVTEYNGDAIFAAHGENSLDLFKTDGTPGGTIKIKEYIGEMYESNAMFTRVGGELYFIGSGSLWKTNGQSEGTVKIRDFIMEQGSGPASLTDLNGTLYFSAAANGYDRSLWKTNGTEASTSNVKYYVSPGNMKNFNGTLYFSGNGNSNGIEPWKSDGTEAGTAMIKNITPYDNIYYDNSYPANFTFANGWVFFTASHPSYGAGELWKTNGTEAGTTLVKDIWPGTMNSSPGKLTPVGNTLFFTARDGSHGFELWKSDGSETGTAMVKDIKSGNNDSGINFLTVFNGKLFFQADNGTNGYELWKSDGSASGTVMVKDIRSGDAVANGEMDMGNMIAGQNAIYFSALGSNGANALWKSDGTNAGTVIIKELGSVSIYMLATVAQEVFFIADNGSSLGLWKSDGTSNGTVKVKDLGNVSVSTLDAVKLNDVIYFTTFNNDETGGHQIWRTNGTETGTYQIQFEGSAYNLTVSGGIIYFVGYTNDYYGEELYKINDTNQTAARTKSDETLPQDETIESADEVLLTSYPNPFAAAFNIRVNGKVDDVFELTIFTMNGAPVAMYNNMKCNVDHALGANWADGIYVLKVYTGTKFTTQKVVKTNQ